MRNFKKVILMVVSGLLVMSLFSGCASSNKDATTQKQPENTVKQESTQNKTSDSTQQDQKNIGLVVSTLNNPFFVNLKNGTEEKAKELGYNLIVVDSQNDSMKEASNIEDLIAQKVDLILINPTDSDAVVNSVKAANAKKIPVITLDRASNGGDVVAHIASDNVAGGKMAADFIIKQLNGKGKVAELQGIAGTSAARDRGKGFNEGIASNNDIEIIAQQAADFDRAKGLSVMENILQAQPEINAVFAHNDEMALGAIKAIEAAKRSDIVVVGFDAVDDAVQAVKDGKLAATVAQQPELIGSLGIENADKVLKGEKVEKSIPVELKLVTK